MRGSVYVVAVLAAIGIMIAIATMPAEQSSELASAPVASETVASETVASETAEVLATSSTVEGKGEAEAGTLTLAIPEMHCEFMCFPRVKATLEGADGVELVELGPQKEEGAIDNRQVIVKYKPGFDVTDAIARLVKEGFTDSDLVQ